MRENAALWCLGWTLALPDHPGDAALEKHFLPDSGSRDLSRADLPGNPSYHLPPNRRHKKMKVSALSVFVHPGRWCSGYLMVWIPLWAKPK